MLLHPIQKNPMPIPSPGSALEGLLADLTGTIKKASDELGPGASKEELAAHAVKALCRYAVGDVNWDEVGSMSNSCELGMKRCTRCWHDLAGPDTYEECIAKHRRKSAAR